ncbi:hypothetical protein PMAYCL1PPCAC_31767, partial [Pristionchus mayeri]
NLTVQNNGIHCGTATCPNGTNYVEMDAAGNVIKTINTTGLTCTSSGSWKTSSGEREFPASTVRASHFHSCS